MPRNSSAFSAGVPGQPYRRFRLRGPHVLVLTLLLAPVLRAAEEPATTGNRAEAYYHFALGHLYHQFAQQFMRQEYVDRAVDEYTAALVNDPDSLVIRSELINLYAGANKLSKAVALAEKILAQDPENLQIRRQLGNIYRSYATKQRQAVDTALLLKSIQQFEKVAELEPDNAENHLALGLLYRSAQEPQRAEKALQRALELDPSQPDAQVNLAYLLLEAGKIQAAIEALERIVEAGSTDRRHLNAMAGAYEQIGRFRDAAAMFRRLVDQGGNTLQARQRLAENLFRSRQFGKAGEQYRELLDLDPRNAEYYLRIALIEREQKDYRRAWEALENARRLDPDSVRIQFQAISLLEAEGKAAQAVRETQKLLDSTKKVEYSPSERRRRSMLLEQLGILQRDLDDFEAALGSFQRIGSVDPELKPRAMIQVIETLRTARDYARAEKEARKAVEEFKQEPALVNLLASVLADRGKTREAIRVLERLRTNSSQDLELLLVMARIYEKGRQFNKGFEQIDQASRLVESDEARIRVLFAYGSLHERAKEYEKSEAKFRELLALDPDNASALNYLGYMFADRSVHLDEAHDLIQRALDLDPENGAYLDSLGWVYFRQNKLGLAAKFLERSLEQYEDDPVVHTHLGDVYYKQGRIEDAKVHWSRGLEAWNRSAPADRNGDEIESLKRKLAELELSQADVAGRGKKKEKVQR